MIRRMLAIALLLAASIAHAETFRRGGPATIDNDASCDISHLPAATLLLPYFEVDIASAQGTGETTYVTITNTSHLPQIARMTLWTDLAYPVITFNIYLTGYDVQSINLFDVMRWGLFAPDRGTGADVSPVGALSGRDVDRAQCAEVPSSIPTAFITRMQSAFTVGKAPPAGDLGRCNTAGTPNTNAVGYATIDVVGNCNSTMPNEPGYFENDIRFDNVLTGDYQQVNGNEDFAQANELVHIRAIPEGGTPQERATDARYQVNVPRTFYSRYQDPARPKFDARQPLPTVWAARWISGGATGYETFLKVWRETPQSRGECHVETNTSAAALREIVRFDEEENPEILHVGCLFFCRWDFPYFPATSLTDVDDDNFYPENSGYTVGGWMYLNLDDRRADDIALQSWVTVSMRAEDRFSIDANATALGNGCSAPLDMTNAYRVNDTPIGPLPNTRQTP